MALYHKWDVKNGFAYVLQFFSLTSVGLGGVLYLIKNVALKVNTNCSSFTISQCKRKWSTENK